MAHRALQSYRQRIHVRLDLSLEPAVSIHGASTVKPWLHVQFIACNLLHATYSARRPPDAKLIACNKLHAIILGSGLGYRCQSVCDWWRHVRNVVWRRVTVIITWFHQTLSLAATLWPREYFRTRMKACNYCMLQLQRVACNKLHM